MFEGERGCGSEGDASSTVHPLSRHAYSDVLNVETLPMGLVHIVLQDGEEGMECMGKKERYGVEWGRGMVKTKFHDHQIMPHLQNSNHMWFQYYGL